MVQGRITEAHRTNYTVTNDMGEVTATVRGNFHAEGGFPKVGDYVDMTLLEDEKAVIENVHERRTIIKRRAADGEEEQIIATNVDLIFIVMGLDLDFNISRLERYLLLAKQSDIPAVVVLNKADVVEDVNSYLKEVEGVAGVTPVLLTSALGGDGMPELQSYITPATTAVLLGSSGAGKSTITNWLLQTARQSVQPTREDDNRGRHTTTSRQLFSLPTGGFLIDTPGMRELGVLDSEAEDELAVFDKIESLASECRFSNCDHEKSEGCAVVEALASGEISEREIQNYHKLLREREWQQSKDNDSSAQHYKQTQKRLHQKYAAVLKQKHNRR